MWTPCKTKAERKAKIKALLLTNDRAVQRGVVAIYKYQTETEKSILSTTDSNGVGFSAFDAELLSSFAQRLLKGWGLTDKQMMFARKKIVKYAGQLASLAEAREGTPA